MLHAGVRRPLEDVGRGDITQAAMLPLFVEKNIERVMPLDNTIGLSTISSSIGLSNLFCVRVEARVREEARDPLRSVVRDCHRGRSRAQTATASLRASPAQFRGR